MSELKNLLVALDYTRMDEVIVCYTAFFCNLVPVEKVYFVHVRQKANLPTELLRTLDILEEPEVHPTMEQEMRELVQCYFVNQERTKTEVLLPTGNPLKEILRLSKQKDIDLIVTGQKLRLRGTGVLAYKLVHAGKSSVLLVPETSEPTLKRLVVSTDFSEYSELTLRHVMEMAKQKPGMEIICMHVYVVPTGYITLGVSYESFEAKIRQYAEKKFDAILQQFPELQGRACLNLVKKHPNDDTGEVLVMEARRLHADLLAIGARGVSGVSLLVLGSVTEKVIRRNTDMPLLVFKKKNENLGFIDAIIGS